MATPKISEARLLTIRDRQWKDRWGVDYIPSIWATPQEAPGLSRATILRPQKLGGREFHTLSGPETFAALLALHNPSLWDLHEQRMLFPTPRAHFLFGHPRAAGLSFRPIAGTVDVASRMGILNKHPKVRVLTNDPSRPSILVPFPYIGDLLLYLEDEKGVYVLNWTVKDKFKDFRRRGPHPKGKPRPDVDDASAIDRHRLEEIYHEDAEIRTQQIAGEAIDFELRCNLRDLFLEHSQVINIPEEMKDEITAVFKAGIGTGILACNLAREVAAQFKITDRNAVTLLKQGIWKRLLRVDLFRPILLDKPLWPEVHDVFDRYREWFRR